MFVGFSLVLVSEFRVSAFARISAKARHRRRQPETFQGPLLSERILRRSLAKGHCILIVRKYMAMECSESLVSSKKMGKEEWHHKMKILTYRGIRVLEGLRFRSSDFWEGYKLYCYARYSDCKRSKVRFVASKMGRVFCELHDLETVEWSAISDSSVREVWAMMEEYAELCHGEDWKNLRSLMEEFDNVKELSKSEKGYLLLQILEDDGNGTKNIPKHCQRIEIQGTNIFEEIREKLNSVTYNLDRLKQSSRASAEVGRK